MELTPQLFRDVEFTERRGAYDKDEVHAFLARVGTAVGQLQERVRDAQRRVEAAEEQLARAKAIANEQQDANETIQRTITMAARAAEEEIKDARAQGEAIVAEARNKADEMIVQAEEAVRRDVGATRDKLQAEIRELEEQRNALRQRLSLISDHLDSERSRLVADLDALKAAVDDPSKLMIEPVPGVPEDDDDLSHLPPPPVDWKPDSVGTEPANPVSDDVIDARVESDREDRPGWTDSRADQPADDSGSLFGTPVDEAPPEAARIFDAEQFDRGDANRPDDNRPDDNRPDLDLGGPPTEATPVVGPGTAFGGAHLDELRRAVSEDADDAEADAAMAAFFDQDTDEDRARRFGRRR